VNSKTRHSAAVRPVSHLATVTTVNTSDPTKHNQNSLVHQLVNKNTDNIQTLRGLYVEMMFKWSCRQLLILIHAVGRTTNKIKYLKSLRILTSHKYFCFESLTKVIQAEDRQFVPSALCPRHPNCSLSTTQIPYQKYVQIKKPVNGSLRDTRHRNYRGFLLLSKCRTASQYARYCNLIAARKSSSTALPL